VSPRAEFFLGVIAVATLTTAIIQIGVLVAAGLLVRRIQRLVDRIDHELKPIFESVQSIGRDAARVTSLAAGQVERLDRAMTSLVDRMERALSALQGFIEGPLSESAAWFAGLKAVLSLIRDFREKRASRNDEEDALFI
jgi:predicted PurR-regulated permease PerM